jgi:hypothetical protein
MPIEQFVVTDGFGARDARSPSFRFGGATQHDNHFHGGSALMSPKHAMSSSSSKHQQRPHQQQHSIRTILFYFIAHCVFASTQSLFNDLLFMRGGGGCTWAKLNAVDPWLQSAWFQQPLSLE